MHSKHLAHFALLLLPCLGHAQDTLPYYMADHMYFSPANFANAQDSAEFTQFRAGLRTVEPTSPADTARIHYRMVWQENQHGVIWTVTRGDGSVIRASMAGSLVPYDQMNLRFATADGRRGVLVMHEIPCGLICRSARYYVDD